MAFGHLPVPTESESLHTALVAQNSLGHSNATRSISATRIATTTECDSKEDCLPYCLCWSRKFRSKYSQLLQVDDYAVQYMVTIIPS